LKDKLINIKIKSITNLSINTTYPLKKILVKIYFAKFATHVFCCCLSKRTNILWYVYYLYFKWRTIFKSVLKDKPINRKIKSITNLSINTTYFLKEFWSKFTLQNLLFLLSVVLSLRERTYSVKYTTCISNEEQYYRNKWRHTNYKYLTGNDVTKNIEGWTRNEETKILKAETEN